ncbi:MAG: 23S rRNA (adenine(2503)-C(2))-methyltransferase RlmN [Actinomycetia bacterium]|nr:23S rRNA (adenine(2503)-C(2))-methyltransferase RlmN [Actinomycetes bacterium]
MNAAPLVVKPGRPAPQSLLTLYRPDLSAALEALDAPDYRYVQVCEHLLAHPQLPLSEATALLRETREALEALGASTLVPIASRTAPDGTTKLLLEGRDSARVETVLMRYRDRLTVCLSSQVGCPVGCAFCATGAMGFQRNLTVAEIVDQVRAAAVPARRDGHRISNLVYMGMGEPLLNLQAVLDSIRVVTDPVGMSLAHRAISVSSVGIPKSILKLARTEPQVNLALSLHAADDPTRARLIPRRFRHPLNEILEAAWEHFAITHRKLLVEYVLLQGINDSPDDARRLAGLLRGHVVTVNLLAWNSPEAPADSTVRLGRPTRPREDSVGRTQTRPAFFAAPPHGTVRAFRDTLARAGIEAVIRQSKGGGIQAACGQLAGSCRSYDRTRS